MTVTIISDGMDTPIVVSFKDVKVILEVAGPRSVEIWVIGDGKARLDLFMTSTLCVAQMVNTLGSYRGHRKNLQGEQL